MKNIKRQIIIKNNVITVDLNKPAVRWAGNPILTCHDVNKVWTDPKYHVITVHNAGITRFKENVIMLFRSHLRNGISVIGLARSSDGLTDWKVQKKPAMIPCSEKDNFAAGKNTNKLIENEAGGVEDPRISKIGDTYFITYSAYHGSVKDRVRVSLATTKDFKTFFRYGELLNVDMRNVVIFPEKINDKYYALMRPNDDPSGSHTGGIFKEIRIARTSDIYSNTWEIDPKPVMKQGDVPSAFGDKIGPGATPIKTKYGWLNIFHGVRSTMDGNPYVLGAAFHDLENPDNVKVSNIPVLFPSAADCKVSPEDYVHVPHVVFTCGALRNKDGSILIYYGGNDTVMNAAVSHEDILAALCKCYPQDPLSGIALYKY